MLLVTTSMFGKLEVHASEVVWRFEPITFYMGELRGKLILACQKTKVDFNFLASKLSWSE